MTHTLVRSLIEFYCLRALPTELMHDVSVHLALCPDCRAYAGPARQVAQLLLLAAPDVEPSPSLRIRLLAAAKRPDRVKRPREQATAH